MLKKNKTKKHAEKQKNAIEGLAAKNFLKCIFQGKSLAGSLRFHQTMRMMNNEDNEDKKKTMRLQPFDASIRATLGRLFSMEAILYQQKQTYHYFVHVPQKYGFWPPPEKLMFQGKHQKICTFQKNTCFLKMHFYLHKKNHANPRLVTYMTSLDKSGVCEDFKRTSFQISE